MINYAPPVITHIAALQLIGCNASLNSKCTGRMRRQLHEYLERPYQALDYLSLVQYHTQQST